MDTNYSYVYVFGLVGYFLSLVSYLLYVPEALERYPIIIGMVLISSGYILLFVHQIYSLYIQRLDNQNKKHDRKADDTDHMKKNAKIISIAGYALLAAFFFVIHIFPQITFRLRYYDVLAAIGYFVAFFTKFGYIPMWFAYAPLVLYYILAGSIKVFEKGWVEKLQLVARFLLAMYYGLHLMSGH